jgi:hypothetical protein
MHDELNSGRGLLQAQSPKAYGYYCEKLRTEVPFIQLPLPPDGLVQHAKPRRHQ